MDPVSRPLSRNITVRALRDQIVYSADYDLR
jgi:hypothetical protein